MKKTHLKELRTSLERRLRKHRKLGKTSLAVSLHEDDKIGVAVFIPKKGNLKKIVSEVIAGAVSTGSDIKSIKIDGYFDPDEFVKWYADLFKDLLDPKKVVGPARLRREPIVLLSISNKLYPVGRVAGRSRHRIANEYFKAINCNEEVGEVGVKVEKNLTPRKVLIDTTKCIEDLDKKNIIVLSYVTGSAFTKKDFAQVSKMQGFGFLPIRRNGK